MSGRELGARQFGRGPGEPRVAGWQRRTWQVNDIVPVDSFWCLWCLLAVGILWRKAAEVEQDF